MDSLFLFVYPKKEGEKGNVGGNNRFVLSGSTVCGKFRFSLVLHEQGAWTLVILQMEPASSSRASVRGTRIDTSSSRWGQTSYWSLDWLLLFQDTLPHPVYGGRPQEILSRMSWGLHRYPAMVHGPRRNYARRASLKNGQTDCICARPQNKEGSLYLSCQLTLLCLLWGKARQMCRNIHLDKGKRSPADWLMLFLSAEFETDPFDLFASQVPWLLKDLVFILFFSSSLFPAVPSTSFLEVLSLFSLAVVPNFLYLFVRTSF